ncbi:MAG: hypothetical protein WBC51_07890 [Vicinamibacterales bacterium]
MLQRRQVLLGAILLVAVARLAPPARVALPEKLTDDQFWTLITEASEPNGFFRSDNLLSNELQMQHVIPELVRTAVPGRAYLGVGPEQNFTYIAAVKPSIAFIVDIRRGNLNLHLLYKALFELSADRADFVSALFSKKRPEGLTARSSAAEIFKAFWDVETGEALYNHNLAAVRTQLTSAHKLPLTVDDLRGVEAVYRAFYWYGPIIQYSSSMGGGGGNFPTYAQLMTATDGAGVSRGFLASEEQFAFIKNLHSRNLIVPIIGDFAGPKALRAVGRYLKLRDVVVSAFYLSNVEQYLYRENRSEPFCANVATLPLDSTSTFIRSVRDGNYYPNGTGLTSVLGNMVSETRECGK